MPESGYAEAFYAIAKMLGIPAQNHSPAHVWETQIKPMMEELTKALPPRDATHPGWIDARALGIAQAIAAEQKINDPQMIARIQIGAIEGIKSLMSAYDQGGDPLAGVHHDLDADSAQKLGRFIREESAKDDRYGRESTIRPGFYEDDME